VYLRDNDSGEFWSLTGAPQFGDFSEWECRVGLGYQVMRSPRRLMRERDAQLRIPAWNIHHEDFHGRSYIRKMACAFGWDWGPMAPTAGIWRPISIRGFQGRIAGLRVRQHHRDKAVELEVTGAVEGVGERVRFNLEHGGRTITEACAEVEDSRFGARLRVPDHELWWPNGMGGRRGSASPRARRPTPRRCAPPCASRRCTTDLPLRFDNAAGIALVWERSPSPDANCTPPPTGVRACVPGNRPAGRDRPDP